MSDNSSKEEMETVEKLKRMRSELPQPNSKTVFMKALTPEKYNELISGLKLTESPIFGSMARAQDAAPFIKCPKDAYIEFRLDYFVKGEPVFRDLVYQNKSMKILMGSFDGYDRAAHKREDISKYLEIPVVGEFYGQPCTGMGYTGSPLHLIPEYGACGIIPNEASIFDLSPNGGFTLAAIYVKELDKFVAVR